MTTLDLLLHIFIIANIHLHTMAQLIMHDVGITVRHTSKHSLNRYFINRLILLNNYGLWQLDKQTESITVVFSVSLFQKNGTQMSII